MVEAILLQLAVDLFPETTPSGVGAPLRNSPARIIIPRSATGCCHMIKHQIEVSLSGKGKMLLIPLSVLRAGRNSFTLSCSDPHHSFRFGSSTDQLEKFRDKIADLFNELVEGRDSEPQSPATW
jgi:hypothetical protein